MWLPEDEAFPRRLGGSEVLPRGGHVVAAAPAADRVAGYLADGAITIPIRATYSLEPATEALSAVAASSRYRGSIETYQTLCAGRIPALRTTAFRSSERTFDS